jgi:hypothetical protein
MTLLEICNWLETTAIGSAVRESVWLFPVIESVHLVALASLAGAVLTVDLRLLGVGLRRPPRELLAEAAPWFVGSLVVMFSTGIPLFLSEAVKCYYHPEFWVKMSALLLAIVFTWTVRNPLVRAGRRVESRALAAALGGTSLALWLTVAAAGRWIGFS